MDNKRDAHESMNGFFYQRYCCIYYVLTNQNFEYILEEGYEDIDLIKIDNNREIIQVKYYGNSNETLIYDSGLFKVIKANYNKQNIDKIIYFAYNKNNDIYNKNLSDIFTNKKYFNIGKYFLILLYNNLNKDDKKNKKIKIDIRTINNVDEIYTKNNTQIKNKLYKNINNKIIYDFFSDGNNCNNYFSKFELKQGFSYSELNNKIDENIVKKYTPFINTNNEDNKQLRITLIKNTILNILTDEMFSEKVSNERKILYSNIIERIDKEIQTYTNRDNLYYELLKQTEKTIIRSINNKIQQLNIDLYINEIKKINIDSLDNISFYICLLNNYYNKLNQNETKNIKNYVITFIQSKYKFESNIEHNFLLIKYLNMIVRNKTKKGYNIPHEKLIVLIDNNHKVNKFFN